MKTTTHDVVALLPRLIELRKRTEEYISLGLEIHFHTIRPEVEWNLYVSAAHKFFHGPTPEAVLTSAEDELLAMGEVPSTVIVPTTVK